MFDFKIVTGSRVEEWKGITVNELIMRIDGCKYDDCCMELFVHQNGKLKFYVNREEDYKKLLKEYNKKHLCRICGDYIGKEDPNDNGCCNECTQSADMQGIDL